jgi:preprotein translocase subunit SecF
MNTYKTVIITLISLVALTSGIYFEKSVDFKSGTEFSVSYDNEKQLDLIISNIKVLGEIMKIESEKIYCSILELKSDIIKE